ncbi:MAG: hypothetical protein AAGH88_00155 [Planctomycetota bacterium]
MFDPITRLLTAIGVIGVLAIVGAAQPPDGPSVPDDDNPQSPPEYVIITGQISTVDIQAQTFEIQINPGDQPTTITVTQETRYRYNGAYSDQQTVLQVGTQVAVRHIGGKALAVSQRQVRAPD